MKLSTIWCLWTALLAVPACSAHEEDDATGSSEEALVVSAASRRGTIAYGETKTVSYDGNTRYQAYSFTVEAGDAIDVRASSTSGDPVLWLLKDTFATLAKNDDVSPSDSSSRIERKLTKAGTYWIVVSEAKRRPATIAVTLSKEVASPPADDPPVATVVPVTRPCSNTWGSCVTASGKCNEHYACPVSGRRDWESWAQGVFVLEGSPGNYRLGRSNEVSSSSSRAGEKLAEWLRLGGGGVTLDGQERGVWTTSGREHVYVKGTEEGGVITLNVRFEAPRGSEYGNGAVCSRPEPAGAGCVLTVPVRAP